MKLEQFYGDITGFQAFGLDHILPIALLGILGHYWILKAKEMHLEEAKRFGFKISLILPFSILSWMLFRAVTGVFDPAVDLPFHLCNLLCFLIPFLMLTGNRKLFGVLYFWVLVGTVQAVITPNLHEPFPHYIYFRYWLVHCGLIMCILYCFYIYRLEVHGKDIVRAILMTNVYLIFSLAVNMLSGGNYFYSMQKPDTASLLDYLGPWPWYLITGQLMMLGMFVLYYLPIYFYKRSKQNSIVSI